MLAQLRRAARRRINTEVTAHDLACGGACAIGYWIYCSCFPAYAVSFPKKHRRWRSLGVLKQTSGMSSDPGPGVPRSFSGSARRRGALAWFSGSSMHEARPPSVTRQETSHPGALTRTSSTILLMLRESRSLSNEMPPV